MARPIYVEIDIRAPLDTLWNRTQDPDLHARWDLRFTDIEYLPRQNESEPQHFLYTTRIGFGLAISGTGSSVGERDGSTGRTSALRFGSDDPKSLIREGSGYWQYQPQENSVRFLTRYGYSVRFGSAGEWFDRLIFRPLLGWATAWSFDRLRLWLEQGIDPAVSMQRSATHAIARVSLAVIWIYHGLVPKILFADSGELEMLRRSGLFGGNEPEVLIAIGLAEIGFGLLMLVRWHARYLYLVSILLLILLGSGAAISQPAVFTEPFNPATLSVAMVALAAIGFMFSRDLPSAARCLRRDPGGAR